MVSKEAMCAGQVYPSGQGMGPHFSRTPPETGAQSRAQQEGRFSSAAFLGPVEVEWLYSPLKERGFSSGYIERFRTSKVCAL